MDDTSLIIGSRELARPIETGPLGLNTGDSRRTSVPQALLGGFHRLPDAEQARLAMPVLREARRLIVADGWCQGALRDARGRWSVYGAVAEAAPTFIEAEYARRQIRNVLRKVDIPGWNDAPERLRSEVTEMLLRASRHAARVAGVARKGGWAVSR